MSFRVMAHDDAWPRCFDAVRRDLILAFDDPAIAIEHIGSTAVPGLCAKPVIDVLVGAASLARIEAAIPRLERYGFDYVSKYETELPMRRYFVKPEGELPRVHVHGVCTGSSLWNDHLGFRDALRGDPKLREDYALLKHELACIHAGDKSAYTAAKAPFIQAVLAALRSGVGVVSRP